MELELVNLYVRRGTFIKITKKKNQDNPDSNDLKTNSDNCREKGKYYVVYFPVDVAEKRGQQLSETIFTSESECESNARRKHTFKRLLLNKCEGEFMKCEKQYLAWKSEMKAYEESKQPLSASHQIKRTESLEIRRLYIRQQVNGNLKFVGQLYKKGCVKEKILQFWIASRLLLNLPN